MRSCVREILELRDRLHDLWEQVRAAVIRGREGVFIRKGVFDRFVSELEGAVGLAERCIREHIEYHDDVMEEYGLSAHEDFMEKVLKPAAEALGAAKSELSRIKGLKRMADETLWHGIKVYALPPEEGWRVREMVVYDINRAVEAVHNVGLALAYNNIPHYGCRMSSSVKEPHPLVTHFCYGVQRAGNKNDAVVVSPTEVQIRLCQHASTIKIEGDDVVVEYLESNHGSPGRSWRERGEEVIKTLEKWGFRCKEEYAGEWECRRPLSETKPEDMTKLAVFLSNLLDIDLLPRDLVPRAVEAAAEYAEECVKEMREKMVLPFTKAPLATSDTEWLDLFDYHEETEEGEEEEW